MTTTSHPPRPGSPATGASFGTTHWTVILGAAGADTTRVRTALDELCRVYWRPVYAFVRRLGHGPHDAQDLTQEFFSRLLSGPGLSRVDPARGRFRSFLLAALKNFLANEWDRSRALKRGGGATFVPVDAADTGSEPGAQLAAKTPSPEGLYDREWAVALLDRVLARLRDEFIADGKERLFEALRETLTAGRDGLPYATIGASLKMSEGAVKVAVHRLRLRYRELLRTEVASTVSATADVEAEMRELMAALSD